MIKITIIGSGYVGLVAGACFANLGFKVCCLDNNEKKIQSLKKGVIDIYEPGLAELVKNNIENNHISFSTNKNELNSSEIIIIAVGTPQNSDGNADLSYLDSVIDDIINIATQDKYIIIKSTVPVGTANKISRVLKKRKPDINFEVISNPEFLREGSAVRDFMEPDRIILGCTSEIAKKIMLKIYTPFAQKDIPLIFTKNSTAELIKYASNCYLAMRIAFINEIADIAEMIDANIEEVSVGMGYDKRIGRHYLHAGPGFGGSCFPKDTTALSNIARSIGAPSKLINAVIQSNNERKSKIAQKILNIIHPPHGKTIAILGLTFKPDTDDIRESPSLNIIFKLIEVGAVIKAYDPSNPQEIKNIFKDQVTYADSTDEAIEGADALVIVTEWAEFKLLQLQQLKSQLKQPIIIDLRNIFNPAEAQNLGITYISIGR